MSKSVDRARAWALELEADTDRVAALQEDGFDGWDAWLRDLAELDIPTAQACMVTWASAFAPLCPTLTRDVYEPGDEPPVELAALTGLAQRELVEATGFTALARAMRDDPHAGEDIAGSAGDGGAYDAGVAVWFALEAVTLLCAKKLGRAGEAAGNAALGAQSVFGARDLEAHTAELLARAFRLALAPWFAGGEPDYPSF